MFTKEIDGNLKSITRPVFSCFQPMPTGTCWIVRGRGKSGPLIREYARGIPGSDRARAELTQETEAARTGLPAECNGRGKGQPG